MGRAFNRLEKTVSGRRAERMGYVNLEERMRNLEMMVLEISVHLMQEGRIDKDNPKDNNLVAAAADYRATLERVLGR